MPIPHRGADHEFVKRNHASGGCLICYQETQRRLSAKRRADASSFIREYKTTKGCAVCGYNKHHAGLDLDHVVPTETARIPVKLTSLTIAKAYVSDSNIQVLCKNCHGIKTFTNKEYASRRIT